MERWLKERCSQVQTHSVDVNKPLVPTEIKCETITTSEGLKKLAARIRQTSQMSLTAITDGINPVFNNLVGLGIAVAENEAYYIPLSLQSQSADLFTVSALHSQISSSSFVAEIAPLLYSISLILANSGCATKTVFSKSLNM